MINYKNILVDKYVMAGIIVLISEVLFGQDILGQKSIGCQKKLGPQKLRLPKNWVQKVKSGQ